MKKALTLLLALMLCVSLAAPALAVEPTSGECGENVTWSYSDGTLTISGTGEIKNYMGDMGAALSRPWKAYEAEIAAVIIGDGVTRIGAYAFYLCENLTHVTIPASVTSIGTQAFDMCRNVTDVYYGGSESQWKGSDLQLNGSSAHPTIHYNSTAPATDPAPSVPGDGAGLSGTCGENVTWFYSDGVLTISGTGDMEDYEGAPGTMPPWHSIEDVKTISIGEGVTHIGDYAFLRDNPPSTGNWNI